MSVAVTQTPGHVIIADGRIVHLDTSRPAPHCDLGGEDCVLTPGFVDVHLHLPQFDAIGIDGLELLDWLDRAIFSAELKWNDIDYARAMISRVGRELHSFGTTSIAAYATSNHAATQAAIDLLSEQGFSGHIGQVLMDRAGPEGLIIPQGLAIGQAASLNAKADIKPAVTPRFAISCTPSMLQAAGKLAAKTHAYVQTHLAETLRENEAVATLFPGKSYTQVYHEAGLLTSRTLLGHSIHLSTSEQQLIATTKAIVAHCPTANRFLHAGTMNWRTYSRANVALALGSDVGAGPDRSMVRIARAAIDASKQSSHNQDLWLPASQVWWSITAGNADALGLTNRGRLSMSSIADLLILKPNKPLNPVDPVASLLYSWDDRWLTHTIACGRVRWSADQYA